MRRPGFPFTFTENTRRQIHRGIRAFSAGIRLNINHRRTRRRPQDPGTQFQFRQAKTPIIIRVQILKELLPIASEMRLDFGPIKQKIQINVEPGKTQQQRPGCSRQ